MITIKSILTILVALGLSLGAALEMGEPAHQAAIHQAVSEIGQRVKAVADVGAEVFLGAEATTGFAGRDTASAEVGVQTDADVGLSAGVETFLHQALSTIGNLSTQSQGQARSDASVSVTTDLPDVSADVDLGVELSVGTNIGLGK
ncbi:MAG: hypothetical protein CVU41_16060 [Chloroflexi bacterium HGW-Chloroflexi-3]|nr:MAG: hypothetical protein CVU41_16060 [Chloroflexi bacterium HGW-Chloroflexi-3]